jgi:hypothetical protein
LHHQNLFLTFLVALVCPSWTTPLPCPLEPTRCSISLKSFLHRLVPPLSTLHAASLRPP